MSLGALMAAAYLAHGDGRARCTLLADPAQGYGAAGQQGIEPIRRGGLP